MKLLAQKSTFIDKTQWYKCLKEVFFKIVGRRWDRIRERGRIQARNQKSFPGNFKESETAGSFE